MRFVSSIWKENCGIKKNIAVYIHPLMQKYLWPKARKFRLGMHTESYKQLRNSFYTLLPCLLRMHLSQSCIRMSSDLLSPNLSRYRFQ